MRGYLTERTTVLMRLRVSRFEIAQYFQFHRGVVARSCAFSSGIGRLSSKATAAQATPMNAPVGTPTIPMRRSRRLPARGNFANHWLRLHADADVSGLIFAHLPLTEVASRISASAGLVHRLEERSQAPGNMLVTLAGRALPTPAQGVPRVAPLRTQVVGSSREAGCSRACNRVAGNSVRSQLLPLQAPRCAETAPRPPDR